MVAFLYPGYASYKILSQRPAPEEELERWLMYWSVLGFVVGIEYVAEWTISWYVLLLDIYIQSDFVALDNHRIPFYYTIKTLFLLYIALPQTKGSSYLYTTHLQPFLQTHETEIDSTLARLKARLYTFLQQRAKMLWDQAAIAMGQTPSDGTRTSRRELEEESVDSEQPTTMGGLIQLFSNLWGSYGLNILAVARAQAWHQSGSGADTNRRPGASVLTTPPSSRKAPEGSMTTTEDRRHEELDYEDDQVPVTVTGLPGSSSESIVKHRVRNRSSSGRSAK